MTDHSQIALVLCLDQNKENKYEYECINCILSWKNKNNYLSDIDIVVYIHKDTKLDISTINFLKKYKNVSFRQFEYDVKYALLKTIYAQYLFEKYETNYQYGIFIDLDMYLTKCIPTNFVFNDKSIFCIYDKSNINQTELALMQRYKYNIDNNIKTFNTEFIINNRKNYIFEKLKELIDSKEFNLFFDLNYLHDNDYFYYEEGIYDYAYSKNILNDDNSLFVNIDNVASESYDNINDNQFFVHMHIKSKIDFLKIKQVTS